ncbi:MAG: hypothetical protein LBU80_06100, partial [Rikenellaceae bacterium]|nr:hypothetical protein [Rikenellaceae bacterium]
MELWQIWAAVAVALFIIELFTPAFFVACFGIGAGLAAVAAAIGMNVSWQFVFFAAGSLMSFVLVRPFVLKYIKDHGKAVKTN